MLPIGGLKEKLLGRDINLNITRIALAWVSRASYNPQFGARPIKRIIQKYILNELSDRILKGDVSKENIINIDYKEGKLVFTNISFEELEKLKTEEQKAPEMNEKPKVKPKPKPKKPKPKVI